jgi:hypothetical protein
VADEAQEWQGPIVTSLWQALIGVVPAAWDNAVLELEVSDRGFGAGLSHTIVNADGQPGLAFPDDAVFLATRRLELAFHERGLRWRRAVVRVSFYGGHWRCSIDYEY